MQGSNQHDAAKRPDQVLVAQPGRAAPPSSPIPDAWPAPLLTYLAQLLVVCLHLTLDVLQHRLQHLGGGGSTSCAWLCVCVCLCGGGGVRPRGLRWISLGLHRPCPGPRAVWLG